LPGGKPAVATEAAKCGDSRERAFSTESAISERSGAWLPPSKYRNNDACDQNVHLEADLYPVPDRGGIPMSNHFRPVYEQTTYEIIIEIRDFSLHKATPQSAAAVDAQIDRDDAGDDFIKEKLHATSVYRVLIR
jgi:hypothetical protein